MYVDLLAELIRKINKLCTVLLNIVGAVVVADKRVIN